MIEKVLDRLCRAMERDAETDFEYPEDVHATPGAWEAIGKILESVYADAGDAAFLPIISGDTEGGVDVLWTNGKKTLLLSAGDDGIGWYGARYDADGETRNEVRGLGAPADDYSWVLPWLSRG